MLRTAIAVSFFQSAHKFTTRYATLGSSGKESRHEHHMQPTAFARKELTAAEEIKIGPLAYSGRGRIAASAVWPLRGFGST
jgi:hypothetical protein